MVYDTVCTNRRKEHTVLEDVVTCNTEYEERCEGGDHNNGTIYIKFFEKSCQLSLQRRTEDPRNCSQSLGPYKENQFLVVIMVTSSHVLKSG